MRYLFQKKNLTFLWIAAFLIGGFFVFTNGIFASSVEVSDSVVAENQVTTPVVESTEPVSLVEEIAPAVDISTPESVTETTEVVTTEPVATEPVIANPIIETGSISIPVLTEEAIVPDVLTEVVAKPEETIVSNEIQSTPVETWLNNGSKFTTISNVELNKTYVAPQNNQVTVTFTKLPDNPGTLSIEEITLTPEQITLLGALSDKAYDITSNMVDGTFEFDLTLPKPVNHESAEIKFAETISDLKNAETVAGNEIKIESDSIKASFNHFTFFVVTKERKPGVAIKPIVGNACMAAGATNGNDCFFTIQEAINAASSGDTIKVKAGTFIETGQIIIDKNLTIIGLSKGDTIIKPAQDTGAEGDSRGWFLVKNGISFSLENVTLDGSGYKISQAIRSHGPIDIKNSVIKNILYNPSTSYEGRGIVVYDGFSSNITGNTLENIGRIGIFVYGANTEAIINNNVYKGKGAGLWLDYGIEIGAGGKATIENNNISDCSGVAGDESTSAGIIATTYYGDNTQATITGNIISNSTDGIVVGYNENDSSSVSAHNNLLGGNINGINSVHAIVDATNNWWGNQSGPYDIIATDGSTPATNNGLGSAAMGAVNYGYWCLTSDCTSYYEPTLAAPINLTPVNDTYTNNPSFDNTWSPVSRAIGYEYRTSYSVNGENLGNIIYSDSSISKPERYNITDNLVTRHNIDAPDATYYWQVRAINTEGTDNPWSEIKKVTVDKTAPSVPTNGQPNDQYKLSNEFDFTWSASSDNLGGLVTYEFQSTKNAASVNGVLTTGLWKSPNPLTSAMIHSSGASDGTWYWQVRAVDKTGNKSSWSPIWKMTIDSLIPTLAITSPAANQAVKGSVITIKGTAIDNNFNYYYCYITGASGEIGVRDAKCETAWWAGVPFKTAFAETINGTTNSILGAVTLNNIANGNYTIHLVGKDKAGNSAEITQPFVLDNTKPVISFVAPESFATPFKVGPTVKVTASDNNGLGVLVIHVYDSAGTLLRNSCTATVAELAAGNLSCDLSNLAEGTYYIKAGTNDKAGNNVTITSEKFVVDNTAPTVSLIFSTPGPDAKSFQAVFNEDVNVVDATNPANYFLSNWPGAGGSGDLVGDATITYDVASKTATISFTNPDWYISAEQQWGVQNIHDLAGNVQEPILVANYSSPMLAPVTTINLTGTFVEDTYTSSVAVALNATDGDSSVGSGVKATYYSINNSVFTAGTSALIETNGDYNIKYYSEDNAGNVEVEKNITFKVNISSNNEDTTLADAKLVALEALAQAFATYTNTDYTDENWLVLSGFDTDGITAINSATTLDEITLAKTKAIDGMAGVEKKQEEPTRNIITNFGGGGAPISYCSNVEYGEWGTAINGMQQRGILSRTPSNCSLSVEQQLNMTRPLPIIQQVLGEKKYADGTLLKGTNNRIYVVIGGKLLYITNFKELAKYHGPILKVSDEVIDSFAKLSVLGVKKYADGTLIRAKGDIKVYIIKNGKKVQIKTLTELKKYKGIIIYTVTPEELNNY